MNVNQYMFQKSQLRKKAFYMFKRSVDKCLEYKANYWRDVGRNQDRAMRWMTISKYWKNQYWQWRKIINKKKWKIHIPKYKHFLNGNNYPYL